MRYFIKIVFHRRGSKEVDHFLKSRIKWCNFFLFLEVFNESIFFLRSSVEEEVFRSSVKNICFKIYHEPRPILIIKIPFFVVLFIRRPFLRFPLEAYLF